MIHRSVFIGLLPRVHVTKRLLIPVLRNLMVALALVVTGHSALAIQCIQDGSLPEEGAVDCQPSRIVEDRYSGPVGITLMNPICREAQDNAAITEACLKDFMSTFRSCFIKHVLTADWYIGSGWSDHGMTLNGEETFRTWYKDFESQYGQYKINGSGQQYCDNAIHTIQVWGMADTQTALCPPGLTSYDWFGPSDDEMIVCADPSRQQCPRLGNPIDLASGAKIYSDMHIQMNPSTGLGLSWHYNSSRESYVKSTYIASAAISLAILSFPDHVWHHNFDKTLLYSKTGTRPTVRIVRPEGDVFFVKVGNAWKASVYGHKDSLTERSSSSDERWEYRNSDDTLETYSAAGKLMSTVERSGRTLNMVYSGGRLARVEASPERFIRFEYKPDGTLSAAVTSAGDRFTYEFDPTTSTLQSVTFPGGASRQYKYAGTYAHLLTGVIDELGKRVASYDYDLSQRPYSTQRAGGVDHYGVTYTDWVTSAPMTVVDPLGASASFAWRQLGPLAPPLYKMTSQTLDGLSAPLAGLESWWQHSENDTNGNITMRQDFAGVITRSAFDLSRNLQTFHADDADTAAQQNTNTRWHSDWRLPTQRAAPGVITTWMHNGQTVNGDAIGCAPAGARHGGKPLPAVCWVVEQPTADSTGVQGFDAAAQGKARVQRFTYNATGQVLLAEQYNEVAPALALHPNTLPDTATADVRRTFTYAGASNAELAEGDLKSLTLEYPTETPPPAPQVTTFTRYNARGQVLNFASPEGNTALSYHRRGWLTQHQFKPAAGGAAQVTLYKHDDAGQLKKATLPDGSSVNFKYDDAHRLKEIWDSAGNRVVSKLDAASNLISEQVTGSSDALDRLQAMALDPFGASIGLYPSAQQERVPKQEGGTSQQEFDDYPAFYTPLPIVPQATATTAAAGSSVASNVLAACARVVGVAGLLLAPSSTSACDMIDNPPECYDDRCSALIREIHRAMDEIESRIGELLIDRCDFYNLAYDAPNPDLGPTCPGSWTGHIKQVSGWKRRLSDLISKAEKMGCPVPAGAKALANRPLPKKPRGWYPK